MKTNQVLNVFNTAQTRDMSLIKKYKNEYLIHH